MGGAQCWLSGGAGESGSGNILQTLTDTSEGGHSYGVSPGIGESAGQLRKLVSRPILTALSLGKPDFPFLSQDVCGKPCPRKEWEGEGHRSCFHLGLGSFKSDWWAEIPGVMRPPGVMSPCGFWRLRVGASLAGY